MNGGYGRGPFYSVHGKKRKMQNLKRNRMGNKVCVLKMVAGKQLPSGTQICSVHGKQRSMTDMEKV